MPSQYFMNDFLIVFHLLSHIQSFYHNVIHNTLFKNTKKQRNFSKYPGSTMLLQVFAYFFAHTFFLRLHHLAISSLNFQTLLRGHLWRMLFAFLIRVLCLLPSCLVPASVVTFFIVLYRLVRSWKYSAI